MKRIVSIFCLLLLNALILSCSVTEEELPPTPPLESSTPENSSSSEKDTSEELASLTPMPSPTAPITYGEVFKITYTSCLPCHNQHTLPQIIERVKAATFNDIDGDTRLRMLSDLEGLKAIMDDSTPYSFSSGEEVLRQFFIINPGGFYTMLEKGVMPPPWAPDLMKAIDWPNYERLSVENRVKLLRFSKPYSKKYIR